ncbi:hypothetical protein V2S66_06130 [Streptomyces sp. V4-01]|uniref:Uncharacterized protein n=1 Tax=Actinacidiphila polyblastidii TaxID=3110430 RepID=A0ABU7P6U9_9ACTN|nr:hypothetical protein [Streptomyces sp. V4-01]
MSLTGFGLAPPAHPLFGAAVAAAGPAPVFLASAGLGACGGVAGLLVPAVRTARLARPAGAKARAPAPAAAPAPRGTRTAKA